jgi:hypothetical protein
MEANYQSAQDAVSSYQFAHASELAYAGDAIIEFFATATYELPEYDTATEESKYPLSFSTDIPHRTAGRGMEHQDTRLERYHVDTGSDDSHIGASLAI